MNIQERTGLAVVPWSTRPLSACIDKVKIPTKIPRNSFQERGKIPIISQESAFINGYWDNEDDSISVSDPVVIFGDHTKILKLINFNFVVGADGVKILKPKGFLDAAFLCFFLEAYPVPSLGYARHFRHISELEVPLPPLEEQKRIVAVLDHAFAAIDRARAHAEANLAAGGALFESWLTTAFKFGLDHWPRKAVREISENLDRLRVPITKKDRKPGDVPYYGASGVVDHVADHIFNEPLLLVSEDGANLLARTYPIAFSIAGKSWVNNHAHVLRFADIESQEFVRLYLNSISLKPWVSGMAQPKLNQKALGSILLPYPGEKDRARIVAEASEVWRASEALKANFQQQIADIAALRQSILKKAFSGQLTA